MADDVEVGIDGSGAKKGADQVVKNLERIATSADSVSKRAGARINSIFDKIQKLANVAVPAAAKIAALNNLANAVSALGSARGPSASAVRNISQLVRVISNAKMPNLSGLVNVSNALSGFKGPSAKSVANLRDFFKTLSGVGTMPGLAKIVTQLRFIAAAIGPVSSALKGLATSSGAAATGLGKVGKAAGSARADMIGLRASSLSLGGALLRTSEFASALGAAFGIREIAAQISKFQQVQATLTSIGGSAANAAAEMQFLNTVARKYSVYIGDLSSGYAQFRAAAVSSNLTLQQTQTLFSQITQTIRVFNLSSDDAGGVFRALTQIMSKGQLQMEELRGQLGDRLPIAMVAMSRALGVTTSKLNDMVKKGEVAGPVLTKAMIGIGAEMEKMTRGGLELANRSLSAVFAKLQNSFYEFSNQVGNAGLTDALNNIANLLVTVMDKGSALNNIVSILGQSMAFLTGHLEIVAVILGGVLLKNLVSGAASMLAMSTATLAQAAAATTATASTSGFMTSLIVLGAATSTQTGLQNLNTAATGAGTVAAARMTAAIGFQATAAALATGAWRALTIAIAANPFGALLVLLGAVATAFSFLSDKMDVSKRATDALAKATQVSSDAALSGLDSIASLAAKYDQLGESALNAAKAQIRAAEIANNIALQDSQKAGQAALKNSPVRIKDGELLFGSTGISKDFQSYSSRALQKAAGGNEADLNSAMNQADKRIQQLIKIQESGKKLNKAQEVQMDDLMSFVKAGSGISLALANKQGLKTESTAANIAGIANSRGMSGAKRTKWLNDAYKSAFPDMALGGANPDINPDPKSKKGGNRRSLAQLNGGISGLIANQDSVREAMTSIQDIQRTGLGLTDDQNRQLITQKDSLKIAESAWKDYQQTLPNKARYGLDDARAQNDPVAARIRNEADAAANAISLVKRLEEAFDALGKYDSNRVVGDAIDDAQRHLYDYNIGLKLSGKYTDDLYARTKMLSNLDLLGSFDSTGNIGEMARAFSELNKKQDELNALSETNTAIGSRQVELAYDLAQGFSETARQIYQSSRAGRLLTEEMDAVGSGIASIEQSISNSFGRSSGASIRQFMNEMRAARSTGLLDASKGVTTIGTGASSASTAGAAATSTSLAEVVITAMKSVQVKAAVSTAGADLGKITADNYNEALSSGVRLEQIADKIASIQTLMDLTSGGGNAGRYNDITSALNNAGNIDQYTRDAALKAQEDLKDAYYDSALAASKFGSIANNAINSTTDALMDFVNTGKIDVAGMLRSVEADLLKTFVVGPAVSALKQGIAGSLGIQSPEAAGAAAAGNSNLMALMAQQVSMERDIATRTGQSIDQMLQASQSFLQSTTTFSGSVNSLTSALGMFTGGSGGALIGGSGTDQVMDATQPLISGSETLQSAAPILEQSATGLGNVASMLASTILPGWLSNITGQVVATTIQSNAGVLLTTAGYSLNAAAAAMAASSAVSGASGTAGALTSLAGLFHGGGVVGQGGGITAVSAKVFRGAKKYHGGGLAGGEIPAILKRREEVLTEDNPRHISNFYKERGSSGGSQSGNGGSSVSNHNEFNINIAPGGTPAQNQDLADRTAKALGRLLDGKSRSTYDQKSRAPGMKVK